MVRAARIFQLDLAVTGLFVSIQSGRFLPVFTATGTAEGFGVPSEIFDAREMVFVLVKVESA